MKLKLRRTPRPDNGDWVKKQLDRLALPFGARPDDGRTWKDTK